MLKLQDSHMGPIRRVLRQRLENKGLDASTIPGYMRSLTNVLDKMPHMTLYQVNRQMDYVGWHGVELDYHTWELTRATLEIGSTADLKGEPFC